MRYANYSHNFNLLVRNSQVLYDGTHSGYPCHLIAPTLLASWLIGSDTSCDIVVSHPMVSGQHCRLYQYERQFTAGRHGLDQRNLC